MSFLFRIKHCLFEQFALPSILPLSPKSLVPVRLVPARPKIIKYQTPYLYRNPKLKGSESISCTRRMLSSRRREGDRPSTGTGTDEQYRDPSSNPKVYRLRELIGSADTSDGWEKSWEEGVIPWDLGKPTPVLVRLVKSNSLPKGRALVPGCGTGYDVVALASSERYVIGLDISGTAIIKAKQWSDSFPNKNQFTFLNEDFFTWKPEELFDLIFDYTFFCAIDPFMRSAWAKRINQILKPNGELITLIYLISDQKEGPPFNNSLSDYEEVLNPLGFKAISIEDNELAVKPRRGSEKLVRWKKIMKQSSL